MEVARCGNASEQRADVFNAPQPKCNFPFSANSWLSTFLTVAPPVLPQQAINFKEAWLDALSCGRRPRSIGVHLTSPFLLDGAVFAARDSRAPEKHSISALDLGPYRIERGRFWQRWIGMEILTAIVVNARPSRTFTIFVGQSATLAKVDAMISRAVAGALREIQVKIKAFVEPFEFDRSALFATDRYVRGSQLKHFLGRHRPLQTDWLMSQFAQWKQHPRRPKDEIADSLIQQYEWAMKLLAEPERIRCEHNDAFIRSQSHAYAAYFASVEATPLTKEQIEASLTFDDANVTVAAAGSGKTSVMVSKVGYAIKAGYFSEHQILVLAYNKTAARELRDRIALSVSRQVGRQVHVKAQTFHSLGLSLVLGQRKKSSGGETDLKRSRLIDFSKEHGKRLLQDVLTALRSDVRNRSFADGLLHWASDFRYPPPDMTPSDAGTVDQREHRYEEMCKKISRGAKRGGDWFDPAIPTFDPTTFVRSNEEARLANWLYLRSVKFDYERIAPSWLTKKINAGLPLTEHVRVYKPDFTYLNPADEKKRFFHEHFGLNASGRAPDFLGVRYEERAAYKRRVLQQELRESVHGGSSRFIETRSAQFSDGTIFTHLERELTARGVVVGPVDQARRDDALKALCESGPLVDLISQFVPKFRNSGLSFEDIKARAEALDATNRARVIAFLGWMRVYMEALQGAMDRGDGGVVRNDNRSLRPWNDFSGMLTDAVKVLRNAKSPLVPYKLVLVDEFQDISRLQAQLVQGLLNQHPSDSILFCVGDDWQSINRFAGADGTIFKSTHDGLNASERRRADSPIEPRSTDARMLKKTFRCAQGIADVARWFVMRQSIGLHIDKPVESANPATEGVVRVVEHSDSAASRYEALDRELRRLVAARRDRPAEKALEVFVLTRNRQDKSLPEGISSAAIQSLTQHYLPLGLDVAHQSMHGSKGLGRDVVIMVGMDAGRVGYPRDQAQEPLIELLLPPQKRAIEEERRLFYVGLTRAKREVTLLCVAARPSPFVIELERYHVKGVVQFERLSGVVRHLCPHCATGWLRSTGKKGAAVCSRSPFCGFFGNVANFPGLLDAAQLELADPRSSAPMKDTRGEGFGRP